MFPTGKAKVINYMMIGVGLQDPLKRAGPVFAKKKNKLSFFFFSVLGNKKDKLFFFSQIKDGNFFTIKTNTNGPPPFVYLF